MARLNEKTEKPRDAKGTLRRLLDCLMGRRAALGVILILSLGGNILSLLGPKLAGTAMGAAAAGKGLVDFGLVYRCAWAMLACCLGSSAVTFAVNFGMMRIGRLTAQKLRSDVFHKLLDLPVSFFDRNQAGDIISRVSYDVDVVGTCISADLSQILTSLVTVAGSFVMMAVISPVLTAVTLVTIPMAIGYTRRMNRITKPLFSRRSAAYGGMNGFAEEKFSGLATIQSYAREEQTARRFAAINDDAADAYCQAARAAKRMGPNVRFINELGLALIAILGSLLYMRGYTGLDQISAFVLYSRKFSGPINEIANITGEIYAALAAAERVFHLLDTPGEPTDPPAAEPLTDVEGDISLEKVRFGYTPEQDILREVSLHARPGQLVAIVGPTGAGKTTIINLLMRFYDFQEGRGAVDGQDMYGLTRSSLRRSYAMVLQDTWLFQGTVCENIAYGREGATREDVIAAAKAARIHGAIMQLPQGYDTVLYEDGGNISKGQKQLLTIARAMLYDAKMLILDEATSNVDTATERQIQTAMRELMARKTCVVIAHRLSTIQNADHILVIDQGRVAEQGRHRELMERRGVYYRLYAAQFE